MLRMRSIIGIALLLGMAAQAQTRVDELKRRAEHENEHSRGPVYVQIARELVEEANREYDNGEAEKAKSNIQEAVAYAEKAVSSARERGKKIKETEINLRKVSNRVEELRRSVASDEQPSLEEAHQRLEQLRTLLLDHMFGKEKS